MHTKIIHNNTFEAYYTLSPLNFDRYQNSMMKPIKLYLLASVKSYPQESIIMLAPYIPKTHKSLPMKLVKRSASSHKSLPDSHLLLMQVCTTSGLPSRRV